METQMDMHKHRRYVRLDFATLDNEISSLVHRLDDLLRQRQDEVVVATPDLQQQIAGCRTRLRDLERLLLRSLI